MNHTALTDSDIWAALRKGENWAIKYVYSEYAEKLYHYGLKITSKTILVEDALQDLFAELIKNRKNIGNTDNIFFYLLKSYKRKLIRKIQFEDRFVSNEEINDCQFDLTWSIEHELVLEEISEHKTKMLQTALAQLTPRQKEAIYLRFTRELNYHEVAGIMDISVEACRNLISKAISSLRKGIEEKGSGLAVLLIMVLKYPTTASETLELVPLDC